MKLTRRELALLPAAAALAQAGAPPQTDRNELQIARERIQSNADAIARIELPMATEPSFQFKA